MDGSEHQLYKVVKLNGQEKYECAACKRVLSRQQTMETHMRSVHRYVGPALFEKKYRLYKDDPSKKIPRQTLHNKMKAQSSHRGEPMLSVEHFLALPEQLTYSNMEIQDQDRTLSATFIDAAIDADESADLENGYYINTSDNESETSSLLSSDSDDSIVTDSDSDDYDCGANEDNTNEVNCGPSTLQSISMAIMAYVSRHCLTNEAAKNLIDVIKLCCPTVDSVQSLNFPQVQEICGQCEITVFDICNVCHSLFPVDENVYHCQTEACDGLRYKGDLSQQSRKRHKNGFATMNILEQLRHLLEREGIWETIQHRISNRGKQVLTDIIDGSYYKALCRKGGFLSNTNNISLIFNTDGAPLYSSSSVSLWPVFLAVNELPSPHRFSKQNMLMWGIWQGKGKPPFNVYFEPFATHMTNLYETGLQIKPWKLRNAVTVKVAVLLGSLDLQGKAYLLNMTQHNGENGCGTCKEPGVVVKQGKGHTRCYPFRDDNERPAKRTCNSFINDGISAHQGKVVLSHELISLCNKPIRIR